MAPGPEGESFDRVDLHGFVRRGEKRTAACDAVAVVEATCERFVSAEHVGAQSGVIERSAQFAS